MTISIGASLSVPSRRANDSSQRTPRTWPHWQPPIPTASWRWTERGIELAEAEEGARYWIGPLLNNLGWEHYEAGEFAVALARYAVGKTLRALGRADEAIRQLEQAVEWADDHGAPDGWFHEELALAYESAGRTDDARSQAHRAIPLLERDDPSFGGHQERRERVDALAGRDRANAADS
jgi:tetratricopeptide (TPR) repeat protein